MAIKKIEFFEVLFLPRNYQHLPGIYNGTRPNYVVKGMSLENLVLPQELKRCVVLENDMH